jgi:hypothetical protein
LVSVSFGETASAAQLGLEPNSHDNRLGAPDHVGRQHRQQSVDIAGPRCCEERLDHRPLADQIPFRDNGFAAHPPSRPAGQFLSRHRRTLDDRGDLVERHREQIVQHERDPLGGTQPVQQNKEGKSDGIGELGLTLRVAGACGDPVEFGRIDEVLGAVLARPQHVEADPTDDHGQPAGQIGDRVRVGAAGPQPALLNRIVGLVGRSEHAIGNGPQMLARPVELLGQAGVRAHRSPLVVGVRHT